MISPDRLFKKTKSGITKFSYKFKEQLNRLYEVTIDSQFPLTDDSSIHPGNLYRLVKEGRGKHVAYFLASVGISYGSFLYLTSGNPSPRVDEASLTLKILALPIFYGLCGLFRQNLIYRNRGEE